MRHLIKSVRMGNAGDGNVLVPAGKEINKDAVSISERTQHRANRIPVRNCREMWGCRTALKTLSWELKFPWNGKP